MLRNATILVDPSTSVDAVASSDLPASRCCLEVSRGRTRFPRRPVLGERFLIGSGTECDFRLGGNGIPMLHSLIQFDGDQYWLEAVDDSPTLIVNGRPEHYVALHDRDEVRIGGVTLRVHMAPEVCPIAHEGRSAGGDELADLENLSAERLVDLIEREQAMLDRFEARRGMGAEALLDAAQRRAFAAFDEPEILVPVNAAQNDESTTAEPFGLLVPFADDPRPQLLHDVERVVQELDLFSQDLERRSRRMTEREESYAETMAMLLEVQHRLTTQLESLLERIVEARNQGGTERTPARAIA